MTRLLIAASAVALLTSSSFACGWNNVSASAKPAEQTIAMSTYDGARTAPTLVTPKAADAAQPVCAEGDAACAPATK
jgi:hypothetical protein